MTEQAAARPPFRLLESVRCLGCGAVYGKPAGGDTWVRNPGCPGCGYVGWLPLTLPAPPTRSGAGPRPSRVDRPR
jgi:hypothetical protein